ncbi:MAG: excinuclease ABC subunit B [Prevotella multiformis]|uniref:excinuclease ABC subunit B n=1 Tax=Prevotella multiformis TaxID=282402 RepID=UPI003FA049E6
MSKVQLVYTGISQIVGGPELGLLILSDLSHTRQVAIVCDGRMEYELGLRTGDAAVTERLLPEVLCSVNPRMTGVHYEILFNSIIDGQYKALLVDKDDLSLTPVRASDAVLLAQVAKLDIFMEEHLFNRQSVGNHADRNKIALPVNALSVEMLRQALDKAIEEENYELASMLRDELKHRKKEG